jgi:heptosyltransferase-2
LGGQIEETDLELWLTPADEAWAARFWSDFGLTGSKVVFAFGIGASQSKKQWPAQAFGELIDILSSKVEFTPAVVYGSNEKDLAREIQAHTGARLLLLQRPSLREVAAFLSRCTLFIGNDSGPKHMAAAAGIPVVEISCHPVDGDPENALNPCRFGPFTSRAIVVQPDRAKKPCSRACSSREAHCITQVSPAQVADQAICLLYKYGALCVDK